MPRSHNYSLKTCLRCIYQWFPKVRKPVICPNCRSPYWDKPRKRARVSGVVELPIKLLTFKCHQCGHKWVARIQSPGVCPECHTPYWRTKSVLRGRPKGSKTKKDNAYAGRTERVKKEYGEGAYHEWGKKGGNPILLGDNETVVINCVHHWILDRESRGRCKKCGAEKQFAPYAPEVFDKTI